MHDPFSEASDSAPRAIIPTPPTPDASKRTWRAWAKEARRVLLTEDRARSTVASAIAAIRSYDAYERASTVATYLAFGDEIDVGALHHDTSKRFAIPRTHVDDGRRSLTFHPLAGAHLERHRFGQAEPAAGDPVIEPDRIDLVLVPGLVFDRRGVRLGHGMGFYDSFLATLPAGTVAIGITLEACVVPQLPCEAHDVRVTHLATEQGVRAVEP